MYRKILVAHDGSEGAWKAFREGVDQARLGGGELHLLSVEEDLPHYVATIGEFEEVKRAKDKYFAELGEEAIRRAAEWEVNVTRHILAGHEVETIVNFCTEQGYDLLVIGFTGHSNLWGRVWGSTSQSLTRLAPCSVLVVK